MIPRTLFAAALCFAALPSLGCHAPTDTNQPDTATVDDPSTKLESLPTNAKVNPSARLFHHHEMPFIPATVVNGTNIHHQYVEEFLGRPGAGIGRMPMPPSPGKIWTELVADSQGDSLGRPNASGELYYDPVTESLSLGDGTERLMRERVWLLTNQQLMSVNAETGPAVYLNAPKKQHELMKPKPTGATTPKRALDEFEKEALVRLRAGDEVALRSAGGELRVLGAIRARQECLSCHKVEVGTMLGAFTYTLQLQSQETPESHRLKNLTDLTEQHLWAVRSIEAVGGKLTRTPGGTITEANLSFTRNRQAEANWSASPTQSRIRDSVLRHLLAFPELTVLDVSHSLVTDAGLKTISELKNLNRLDIRDTHTTAAGVAELKKALPKCEVLTSPAIPLP